MKLRVIYSKTGLVRFISHRDLMRLFFRAASRAGIPVEFSRGFNPHPRIEFCPPLSVGMEGWNEIIDLRLSEEVDVAEATEALKRELPEGVVPKDVFYPDPDSPSLGKSLRTASYRVLLPGGGSAGTPAAVGEGRISVHSLPGGLLEYELTVPVSASPRRVLEAADPAAADPRRQPFWARRCFSGPKIYRRPPEFSGDII